MARILAAFAAENPDDLIEWRIHDDKDGVTSRGSCLLAELPQEAGLSLVLVLPGTRITSVLASVASRNDKQLRSAAPFAVEDDVGSDLEDVHIAIGAVDASTGLRVLQVVDRSYLKAFLTAFEDIGFAVQDVVADHVLIGAEPGVFETLQLPERILISNSVWSAAIDSGLDGSMIDALVADVHKRWPSPIEESETTPSFLSLNGGDPYDYLAAFVRGRRLSLLQGEFERRRSSASASVGWGKWRAPAGLVAAGAIAMIGVTAAQGAFMRSEAKSVRAETERVFREAFPEVSRVVDPRRQLRAQLGGAKVGASEFLELSSMLALAVESNEGVDVQSLRYDDQQSELQASVAFSSYNDMAQLKQSIESFGGLVIEGGSRQSNGRRLGEITVSLQ